jgi:hypothetical protein
MKAEGNDAPGDAPGRLMHLGAVSGSPRSTFAGYT